MVLKLLSCRCCSPLLLRHYSSVFKSYFLEDEWFYFYACLYNAFNIFMLHALFLSLQSIAALFTLAAFVSDNCLPLSLSGREFSLGCVAIFYSLQFFSIARRADTFRFS